MIYGLYDTDGVFNNDDLVVMADGIHNMLDGAILLHREIIYALCKIKGVIILLDGEDLDAFSDLVKPIVEDLPKS